MATRFQHVIESHDETTPFAINTVNFSGAPTAPNYSSVISSEYVPPQDEDIVATRDERSESVKLYGHSRDRNTMIARDKIRSAFSFFPTALGLLVCISCDKLHGCGLTSKALTDKGSKVMEETFKFLGYATCNFHNPSTELFADICIMLTNDIEFPPSYKKLFLYVCTHGCDDYLNMTNGVVEASNVIKKFMAVSSKLEIPRFLLFDTCRGGIEGNVDPLMILPIPLYSKPNPDGIFGNILTFFSTSIHFKSYASRDGVPIIPKILQELLTAPNSKDIASILNTDIKRCLEERAKTEAQLTHLTPECKDNLREKFFLYKERLVPMTPTEVTISKGFYTSQISWTTPIHAEEQNLAGYTVIIKKPGRVPKTYVVGKEMTTIVVPTRCLVNAEVTIEAKYKDGTGAPTEPKPSNIKTNWILLKVLLYRTLAVCFVFTLPLFILYIALVSTTKQNDKTLAIASDVLECASPTWFNRLSDITIEEVAEDNDNSDGFRMDIFGLTSNDIKTSLRTDTKEYLNNEHGFDTDGRQLFFLPSYIYYKEPWYLWQGSSITISYLTIYSHKPSIGVVYLVKGEKDIDNFKHDKSFHHETSLDFLQHNPGQIHWNIKSNGYYFLAVLMDVTNGTFFKFNVTYTLKYIDPDDFNSQRESGQSLYGIGQTANLRHSLTSQNTNHTLCYLHPTNSGYKRIHLHVSFKPKQITWILPAIFLLLLTLCLIFCGVWT